MKESMWGYALILLGIAVSTFMIMISNMTTTNQQDYYLLKEITNAAMIDAIDFGHYATYGEAKINTEKFVENFMRRFAESISKTNTYKIDFYSLYENPPKVSIRVTSNTGDFHIWGDSTNIDVINSIDAVLEANNIITTSKYFYSVPYSSCKEENYITKNSSDPDYGYCQLTNRVKLNITRDDSIILDEIKDRVGTDIGESIDGNSINRYNIKVQNALFIRPMQDNGEDESKYNEQFKGSYEREDSIDDVPSGISDAPKYTQDIKDVNLTVKKIGTDYYLAYGLKFKCDSGTLPSKKYYRLGTTVDNVEYKEASTEPDKNYHYCSESACNGTTISPTDYNELSDSDKKNYANWVPAAFNDACLVGIKYKVNFYYDDGNKNSKASTY